MTEKRRKGIPPPRYDTAFKAGAVRIVTEQKRPPREVEQALGVCVETLKKWLKEAGHAPIHPPQWETFPAFESLRRRTRL